MPDIKNYVMTQVRLDVNELLNCLCKRLFEVSCSKQPIRLNESITNDRDNSSLYP